MDIFIFNKISNCLLEHANRNMVKVALIEWTQYDNGVYNHHDSLINNEFKNLKLLIGWRGAF